MINHPNRGRNPILDVVHRSPIGKRHRITRREMGDLLFVLSVQHLVELENGWQPAQRPGETLGEAWAESCRGIKVISILADTDAPVARAASSNPGSIRYDDPGGMHPLLRATLMFAPAELAEMEYDQIGQLRSKAKRVLIVTD